MTAEQYEHILRAALAMKRSKYNLAEALVLDIPFKEEGDGQAINAALEEVAQQIVDMGGDEIAVKTLAGYRDTAFWAESPADGGFRWREGSSFSAHVRAAQGGMDYDEFARTPRTTREVQKMLGQKASVGSSTANVEEMTQTERVDMARALADAEPDIVTDAVVEKQRKEVVKAAEKVKDEKPAATHKEPSTSTVNLRRLDELKDVVSRNVTFTGLITSRWRTEAASLKGFMKAADYEKLVNDLDAAALLYTTLIDELEVSV